MPGESGCGGRNIKKFQIVCGKTNVSDKKSLHSSQCFDHDNALTTVLARSGCRTEREARIGSGQCSDSVRPILADSDRKFQTFINYNVKLFIEDALCIGEMSHSN
eukprot:sb/3477936/